jgi:RimJ/RimL family protein N-acetyltransferase
MAAMSSPTPILETERLRLRPYRPADFEAVVRDLVLDPLVIRFWHEYADQAVTDEQRRAMAEVDFAGWIDGAIARGFPAWVIELTDPSLGSPGAFVGAIGIFPPENEWGPEPEVGYMLASRFHGRGLATEAVRAALGDAFGRLGLARIVAIVDEPNGGSIRVLEKAGFTLDREYAGDDGHPYRRYALDTPIA